MEEKTFEQMKQEVVAKDFRKVFNYLKEDQELFYGWQSNIAMAFHDEVKSYMKDSKNTYISTDMLSLIANNASRKFLNQLIRE